MKRFIQYLLTFSLLLVFAALGCNDSSTNPPATADVVINIVAENGANSFSPNPANVTVGQTVAWHNIAGTTHTATQNGGGFNTGNIANGSTSSPIKMNTAGDLGYHCSIHPTMVGTLHVTQ